MKMHGIYRPDLSVEERVRFAMNALTLVSAAAKVDPDHVPSAEDVLQAIASTTEEAIFVLRGVEAAPASVLNWCPDQGADEP